MTMRSPIFAAETRSSAGRVNSLAFSLIMAVPSAARNGRSRTSDCTPTVPGRQPGRRRRHGRSESSSCIFLNDLARHARLPRAVAMRPKRAEADSALGT